MRLNGLLKTAVFPGRIICQLVKKVRKRIDTPIVLFGYYNPFYQFGLKQLCETQNRPGVDGLLVVDLPPEEAHT